MADALPAGWADSTIGDVCEPVAKRGPNGGNPTFRYIDLSSINNKTKTVIKANELDVDHAPSRAKQVVQAGDVLFSNVRVYLENIASVPADLDGEIASTAFCVLRPASGIEARYLHYFATSRAFIQHVDSLQRGNSPPSVQDGDVKSQAFPAAPHAEQRRIVSKIDELFSRIDEGEQALKRVEKLIERYRQSVLKAAVTGELTRDWREARKRAGEPVESGAALLARILKARRAAWEAAELKKLKAKGKIPTDDRWKQKYKEPAPPNTTDLSELPEGWVWASLDRLCFVETGATPKRGTARFYESGTIDWITSAAVNESLIMTADERITEAAIEETNAKVFEAGSLIVAMYGEGRTRGRVSELGIRAATNQACAALLCSHLEPGIKAYIKAFLEKNYLALRSAAAGGVQPNLNLSIIRTLPVALPPLAEQVLIVSRVAEAVSNADVAASGCGSEMGRVGALRQSILKAAFSGQLVPQDPHDEPASKLLERILAERATTPAAKRGRKAKVTLR